MVAERDRSPMEQRFRRVAVAVKQGISTWQIRLGARIDVRRLLCASTSNDGGDQRMNSTNAAANPSTREGAKRNLVSISPFFIVKDLQASIAYYVERLGFQLDFKGPADDPYYAGVSREGSASCSRPSFPTCFRVQTTRGTHGLVGTRTSTPWTRTRSSTSSPARCVIREGVVVHRRWAVGLRDHRCRRVCPCLLSPPARFRGP